MLGLVAPAIIAVLVGLALGGSLDNLSRQRLRWWPVALLALGVQIPLYSPPFNSWPGVIALGAPLGVITTAMIALLLVRNATGAVRAACLLAAAGVALNLVVIVINGGWMPRLQPVAGRVGDLNQRVSNTAPVGSDTRLAWLGDSIPEPPWLPLSNVLSPGDILLASGAAWWVFAATRPADTARKSPSGV